MAVASASPGLANRGLPEPVLELCRRLSAGGFRAWLVGGCVRDSLLAQIQDRSARGEWVATDWDIASDATPDAVTRLFRRVIPTGIDHGTVTVVLNGVHLEVTTLRTDLGYSDGRRPEQVGFVTRIEEDLARRDFTVNAIAYDLQRESLVDPFGGIGDLYARRIRAVGEPARRFAEDGLRVLRAARFVATLEFELDPATAAAMRPSLDTYRKVSAERVREEWNKTLGANAPSRGFRVMLEHGLLSITAPPLAALADTEIEGLDTFEVALGRADRCPKQVELRLAAMLRDIAVDPAAAARGVDELLGALRYSNHERRQVARLVQHRDPPPASRLGGAELRRWLRRVGPDLLDALGVVERAHLHTLIALSAGADEARSSELESRRAELEALLARARAELDQKPPLSLSQLAIDGKALMAQAGYRPGRELGQALEKLLELVIDDPSLNTPDELLARARALREA